MKQFPTIEKLDTAILYVLELAASISVLLLAFGLVASMANVLTRRLFLSSPLGQREKAKRKTGETTYVDMTIYNVLKKRRNPPQRR